MAQCSPLRNCQSRQRVTRVSYTTCYGTAFDYLHPESRSQRNIYTQTYSALSPQWAGLWVLSFTIHATGQTGTGRMLLGVVWYAKKKYIIFKSWSPWRDNSVQFSSLIEWVVGWTRGTTQQRSSDCLFGGRPLWAGLPRAGMSIVWCRPPRISSADYGVVQAPKCPEEWFWRICRDLWHARTMRVSVFWQLPEEVPVDPQGRWSRSAPSRWCCPPSRRYREVSSGSWFRKPGSFFSEPASRVHGS